MILESEIIIIFIIFEIFKNTLQYQLRVNHFGVQGKEEFMEKKPNLFLIFYVGNVPRTDI